MAEEAARGPRLPGVGSGFLHNSEVWASALPSEIAAGQSLPASEYRRVLLDSVFTVSDPVFTPNEARA